MHAFILAGGFATRLWPLTEKRAKPLLPLAGKPIISHFLDQIPPSVDVTVSTNAALKEGFIEWIAMHPEREIRLAVEHARDDDQKLGALGALAQWIEEENIDDDILLLTGDNYFGFKISDFLSNYRSGVPLIAAFDVQDIEQAKAFGTVVTDANDKVVMFEEKPKEPKTTLVSTGCTVLPSSQLPVLLSYAKRHPDNVGGIFEEILRNKVEIDCFVFSDPWFDIGSFHAYLNATEELVGSNVLTGEGSVMEGCDCEGSVVIGKNCKITDSLLNNVVVFDDCVIDDCQLDNCIIDNNCELRGVDLSGKMLREDTKLIRPSAQ